MATPVLASLGVRRNHICQGDPCPRCGPSAAPRPRSYWCPTCDIYGKGTACWSCGSGDVAWSVVPRDDVPR